MREGADDEGGEDEQGDEDEEEDNDEEEAQHVRSETIEIGLSYPFPSTVMPIIMVRGIGMCRIGARGNRNGNRILL